MKASDKVCHRVIIKNAREKQAYIKRESSYLQGTPKIILGKLQNNMQEIWTDELHYQQVIKLKELNSSERAFGYARRIIAACAKIAPRYGNFIINENMIFFNNQREIFAWINPQILENHVKIYLPNTYEGELAMIRSIITYLKLWLKCDYSLFADAKNIDDLLFKFDNLKSKNSETVKAKSPGREFLANRKNSANLQAADLAIRYNTEQGLRPYRDPCQNNLLLMQNKSNKEVAIGKSPGKDSDSNKMLNKSLSNKCNNPIKFNYINSSDFADKQIKNKTTLSRNTDQISEKNVEIIDHDYEHKTFYNVSQNQVKNPVNQSLGIKSANNYFPNKTTSNRNPIVNFICSQDENPHQYGQNKLLLDDEKIREMERQKLKKMKESLDGIGEELNDLFVSNVESEQETGQSMKNIEEEFENLLS